MTTTVTYLHNQRNDIDRWTQGWKPGDKLRWIDMTVVPEDHPHPAEFAFEWYQRIDGGRGEDALNQAKAPSLSVGDIVVVQDEDTVSYFACQRVGFDRLDEDEVLDVLTQLGTIR